MHMTKWTMLSATLVLLFVFFSAVLADDPSADQIITRHLNSIAPEAKRKELKTMLLGGPSLFESRNPDLKGLGKAVVVSDADDLYFLMSLNSQDYPYEKIGAFGTKVALPFTMAGNQRSLLGAFLHEHNKVLTSDLFCGSMSLRWIAGLLSTKDVAFRASGKRKINGRDDYIIDAAIKGYGSDDFSVRLFFDAEKYYHVRTEYKREVSAGNVVMGQQNNQQSSRLDLTEEFDDFREDQGYTLPHSYKVSFAGNTMTTVTTWSIHVSVFNPNQQLSPDFFTFDIKQ